MNRTSSRGRAGRRARGRGWPSFSQLRDTAVFLLGMVLIGNEAFIVPEPRALIVGLGAVMAGVPLAKLAEARFLTPAPPSDSDEEPGD